MPSKKVETGSNCKKLISCKLNVSLLDYSKLCSMFAVEIAKSTLRNPDESIIESIKFSALLNNIGKCCSTFQKELKKPSKKEDKSKFLHNEIGWAFLSKYLHNKGSDFILDCVYWTNGIKTNRNKQMNGYNNNNVMDTISEADKSIMLNFLNEIIPVTEHKHYYKDTKLDAPIYYSTDTIINSKKTFIRACVISADKLISSLEENKLKEITETKDINEIKKLINYSTKINSYNPLSFDGYEPKRLKKQKEIVELCEQTNIINAPSGFGKTLISLLYNLLLSNKKIIWVCPRNAIAQSTCTNILKELNLLGVTNVSVELYLTGETKKTNLINNVGNFSSDIIVTNIDNFLSPSAYMNNSERLFFINNCNVVFDEYHELVCEDALFACFVNIMNTRSRFTNSRTILISSTPLKINHLWDNGINLTTKILPSINSHYSSVHKKKYQIHTHLLESIEELNINQNTSSLVIFNSIINSQLVHSQIGSEKLIHGDFSSSDKETILEYAYNKFNKNSSRFSSKENITSTSIIQASFDVSFINIYESVLSPQSTLQRIGLCDRWGHYDKVSTINIYKINDRSENKMKEILYTKSLSDKWFDFISKYNGKEMDLDEIYDIYNEFHEINSTEINKYIENCYDKSKRSLATIYPRNFTPKNNEKKIIRAGSNKLRSCNGNEIFFICKVYESEKYSDIISDSNYANYEDYEEDKNTVSRMNKAMKSIRDMKDDRYDYSELIDEWNLVAIRYSAKESNTPYIRFDVVYHPKYGVIKKSILNQINNK